MCTFVHNSLQFYTGHKVKVPLYLNAKSRRFTGETSTHALFRQQTSSKKIYFKGNWVSTRPDLYKAKKKNSSDGNEAPVTQPKANHKKIRIL
jgi:hypothetical protein